MKFETLKEIIDIATEKGVSISHIALDESCIELEKSPEEIKLKMLESYAVMKQAIERGTDKDLKSDSGLSGGMAFKMKELVNSGKNISGGFLGEIFASALAVSEYSACMGKIVAAPTAGSCGILPACLVALQNKYNLSDDQIAMGLINASAVGIIIAKSASISGAEGGCQAECGTAAAMAASAMTEIMGGTPKACGNACAQVIKSVLGLVCDPVAGLVEEPCIIRNVTCSAIAVAATETALAGIDSIIPVDEVICAMKRVGSEMPKSLRETAEGGLATSETGLKIKERFTNNA